MKTFKEFNEAVSSSDSDTVRRLQGYHGKGKSAARIGRLAIEQVINRIDMIKKLDKIDKNDVDDMLLKLKRDLTKDLVAIKNFEKELK